MEKQVRLFPPDGAGRASVYWGTDIDVHDAYLCCHRFGRRAESLLPEIDPRSIKGLVLYQYPEGSMLYEGREALDTFDSWEKALMLAEKVAGEKDFRGFGLLFNNCTVSYTDDRLGNREAIGGIWYQQRARMTFRSPFDLSPILPDFIKETDPTNDLSGLEELCCVVKGPVPKPDPRKLIISTDPYLEVGWSIDPSIPLSDIYASSRQFGDLIDGAIKDAGVESPETLLDKDGNLVGDKALVRRILIYGVDGEITAEKENCGNFDRYVSWEALEKDLKAASPDTFFGGFRIGFVSSDISYKSRGLIRTLHEFDADMAELAVNTHFDIREQLKEFIRQTNPSCDVSELDSVDTSRLRKIEKV